MAKVFRPSTRESSLLSKIESSKERARRKALMDLKECLEPLSNSISMKLVEEGLIETTNKNELEAQFVQLFEKLCYMEDFDIDYMIAPYRLLVPNPHVISIYATAFTLDKLINHKAVVDIYGADEDIYHTIHKQVLKHLPH